MGYYCFITGIYEETFGKKDEGSLSFLPYIYCFIMMYLLTTPLRSINLENTCITNIPSDRFLNRWISFMFFVNIVSLSFYIYTLGSLSSLSYVEIYQLGATGEMDVTTGSNFLDNVFGKCQLITRVCNPLFNISCLFLLSNNPHSKKPLFFFVCTFFIQVPPYLLKGDRGGLFFLAIQYVFYLLLFWKSLSLKIRSVLIKGALSGLVVLIFYSLAISFSRMGEGKDGVNQILRYFGEAFPNLGFNIWDKETNHPMGARFFPSIYMFLGGRHFVVNEIGRNNIHEQWSNLVGIPMLNFKTAFGDIYIEFGLALAFIVVLFYVCCICKLVNRKRIPFFNLAYIYLPYKYCIYSIFGNFIDERESLDFIFLLLMILALRFFALKDRRYLI